ncbi:hypothetical protein VCHE48_2674 [Vibrio cholerae HE48]|nr:hypothetical protein VCHE48_2674 [Vibrio cholerae HE48]
MTQLTLLEAMTRSRSSAKKIETISMNHTDNIQQNIPPVF